MNDTLPYKQFIKSFDKITYRHNKQRVFDDFLDLSLFFLNAKKGKEDEALIERFEKTYTREEAEEFGLMFKSWTILSDNNGLGFYDALGDLFMATISNDNKGQYFTPQVITDFIAKCLGNVIEKAKNYENVLEPSCGSGRMLLSAATENRKLLFYGCDIDETCCKMAALNMIINTLTGEIAHYNPLSKEFYKSWHIGSGLIENVHTPFYYVSTDYEQSIFYNTKTQERAVEIIKNKYSQQSIF